KSTTPLAAFYPRTSSRSTLPPISNKGDLVAVELAVKKWSASRGSAEHGSYDLRGVLLLRKGTAEDEGRVDSATSAPVKNAFSSSFYDTLNSTA
ncbi:hypothetical protein FRC01_004592, partial [Tulasnella sp. 417]